MLGQSFRVGKTHRGLYLQLAVDTGRGWLTAHLDGRVLKRWPYRQWNEYPTPEPAVAGGCLDAPTQRGMSGRYSLTPPNDQLAVRTQGQAGTLTTDGRYR